MLRFSMSDIFFSPVESLSDTTFISRLFDSENDIEPVLPCPGTPNRALGKRLYFFTCSIPRLSV